MAVHTLVAAMLWGQLQLPPSMWPRPCVQPGPLPPAFLCSVPFWRETIDTMHLWDPRMQSWITSTFYLPRVSCEFFEGASLSSAPAMGRGRRSCQKGGVMQKFKPEVKMAQLFPLSTS